MTECFADLFRQVDTQEGGSPVQKFVRVIATCVNLADEQREYGIQNMGLTGCSVEYNAIIAPHFPMECFRRHYRPDWHTGSEALLMANG